MKRRELSQPERDLMAAAAAARNFPVNTCPASRHVHMEAELLMRHGRYAMIEEEPEHVAGSMLSVVASLYEARTLLAKVDDKDAIARLIAAAIYRPQPDMSGDIFHRLGALRERGCRDAAEAVAEYLKQRN